MFPGKPPGPTGDGNWLLVDVCRWELRSGERRRDLPQRYGK